MQVSNVRHSISADYQPVGFFARLPDSLFYNVIHCLGLSTGIWGSRLICKTFNSKLTEDKIKNTVLRCFLNAIQRAKTLNSEYHVPKFFLVDSYNLDSNFSLENQNITIPFAGKDTTFVLTSHTGNPYTSFLNKEKLRHLESTTSIDSFSGYIGKSQKNLYVYSPDFYFPREPRKLFSKISVKGKTQSTLTTKVRLIDKTSKDYFKLLNAYPLFFKIFLIRNRLVAVEVKGLICFFTIQKTCVILYKILKLDFLPSANHTFQLGKKIYIQGCHEGAILHVDKELEVTTFNQVLHREDVIEVEQNATSLFAIKRVKDQTCLLEFCHEKRVTVKNSFPLIHPLKSPFKSQVKISEKFVICALHSEENQNEFYLIVFDKQAKKQVLGTTVKSPFPRVVVHKGLLAYTSDSLLHFRDITVPGCPVVGKIHNVGLRLFNLFVVDNETINVVVSRICETMESQNKTYYLMLQYGAQDRSTRFKKSS